jgi:hypothetical protein
MALSEDQRALLRLLLEGEDYDSIGTLLGEDPDPIRDRAHAALGAIGSDDPRLAAAVSDRIAELDGTPPAEAADLPRGAPRARRLALWLPLGVAVVAVAAIVLVVSGAFEDDSGDSPAPAPSSDQEDVVVIPLKPVAGASAKGTARIIRIEDLPALDIDVVGLEPSTPDESYIVWLYNSPTEAFPLVFLDVGANGRLEGRAPVPAAATSLLASFDGLDVSLANKQEAAAAIDQAAQGSGVPHHVGRSVVRGTFPGG